MTETKIETVDPIRHRGRTVIIRETGERALVMGAPARGLLQVSREFSLYSSRGYKPEDLELAPPTDKRGGYDLKEDLGPIMNGIFEVPNFEPIEDLGSALNNLTLGGIMTPPGSGFAKLPGELRTYGQWAKYFLRAGQNGGLTGEGYVIVYQSRGGIIGRFAICKHKKREGAGANPRRGWHPGSCELCGLDMTVDSGD